MALCGNCFRDIGNNTICSFCGYDAAADQEKYAVALRGGAILSGRYIVGRVLGQGGFGITYSALDYENKRLVAIKEHFPASIVTRAGMTEVRLVSSGMSESFAEGKEKFLAEAKTLSQFNGQPNICDIYSYFEENGTAYFAMEYVEGIPLDDYIKKQGRLLSFEEALRLLLPIMKALSRIHAAGIIHRDLAPDNIMVTPYNWVMLIDFGAARYSMGEKSRSLDVILKHGFAPKEQYARRSRQGAYTDVYAFAATFYYAITGKVPPDAIERSDEDELVPPSKLGVAIPHRAEAVLLKALSVDYKNRFQTMDEFIHKFSPFLPDLKRELEARAAEERRLQSEKLAAERKAEEEKREAERKALEEKRAEEHKALEAKRAEERKALEEKQAAERKAAEEKREAERRAKAEQKALEARKRAEAKAAKKTKAPKKAETDEGKPRAKKKSKGKIALAILCIFALLISGAAFMFRGYIFYGLGYLYETGTNIDQDYEAAFDWYSKSAQAGNEWGMGGLGWLYLEGLGTKQDYDKASHWLSKAAVLDNDYAMVNLGWMYENGYGFEQNYETAFDWYFKSAAYDNPFALNNMGCLYEKGLGVEEDLDAAYKCFTKAAELGSTLAVENLALLRGRGYTPPENIDEIVIATPAPAEAPAEISWEISGDGTLTISGEGRMDDYTLEHPAPWFTTSKSYLSKQILADDSVKRVVISEGITHVGDRAFYNFKAISSISLPDSLVTIGEEAFSKCDSLAEINIPASVTSIDRRAFYNCSSLTDISIPQSISIINNYTFYGCSSLKNISLPNRVSSIGDGAFALCKSLVSLELPASLTHIGDGAFISCNDLETVNFRGTEEQWMAVNFGNDNDALLDSRVYFALAAGDCGENVRWMLDEYGTLTISGEGEMSKFTTSGVGIHGILSTAPWCSDELIDSVRRVVIESGVTSVGANSFVNCVNLREVTFPEGLEIIGASAFHCCDGLSELVFHDGLKKIYGYAFNSCRYISKVTLPASLEFIDAGAFQFNNALSRVEFMGSKEQWNNVDIRSDQNEDLLEASINFAYIAAGDCGENVRWGLDEYGTLTVSGKGAITDCTWFDISPLPEIRRVVIEPGITHVADFAFNGFDTLAEVQLPEGLKSIGAAAFNMCHSLRSIKIPEGLEVIPRSLFYNCENLQSVELPSTLKTIEGRAFMGCRYLSRISIPEGFETISAYAFYNCRNLQSIELPSTLKTIQDFAFADSNNGNNIWVYYAGTEQQWNEIEVGKYCLPRFTISFEQ